MKWAFVVSILYILVGAFCTAALYLHVVARLVGLSR